MADRVVILGGGVGGMSAAHELAERGFEVEVFERQRVPGGKARSIPVFEHHEQMPEGVDGPGIKAGPGSIRRPWLPGEHGFRFFPGFYKHLIDTMARIPVGPGRSAADNLVNTTRVAITQYNKPEVNVPTRFPATPADLVTAVRDVVAMFSPTFDLAIGDAGFFATRVWQIMTSCEERRLAEYEKIAWWDFIAAEERSATYRKMLGDGITRSLVAAKARTASTRTIGDIFVQLVVGMLQPAGSGDTDRVLNGPTNAAWLTPWMAHLERLGVRYHTHSLVRAINVANGRVVGAKVIVDGVPREVRGDWYVSALPVERMSELVSPELTLADPALGSLRALSRNVEWMNGIQFYLTRDIPITHGHGLHLDSEWALTTISQGQFWKDYPLADFGDGMVRTVLSVDVSDWEARGICGKAAKQCSRRELITEVWEQLKRSLNTDGREVLRDADLHYWFLDPDIRDNPRDPVRWENLEPLLVNLVDTWRLRPEATTAVPNLFLASDYVRTYTDLATMEAANEAARRAVNGILVASRSAAPPCALWKLHEPVALAPWRAMDKVRFEAGMPWDDTLVRIVGPLFDVANLVEQALPVCEVAAAVEPSAIAADRAFDAADPTAAAPTLSPLDGGAAPPEAFEPRLGWYRGLIDGTLAGSVPARAPQRNLYEPIASFLKRGGKGLRPALVIATARALGGKTDHAIAPAAAIEMLHNAFLVHDDIEDGSELRRDHPTMHTKLGVPLALNAGDAMTALSLRIVRMAAGPMGSERAWRILAEMDHMLIETLEGQAMELGWIRDGETRVTEADYLRMVLKKTCWYSFIHPMRLGALVADPRDQKLDRFNLFGFLLGAAFQIQDDVLNLVGVRSRYGKEIGGDLLEGKRTLILTHLLENASGGDGRLLRDFLVRPRERKLPREVHRIYALLDRHDSIGYARAAAGELLDGARREFAAVWDGAPPSPDLDFIRQLMDYLVARQS